MTTPREHNILAFPLYTFFLIRAIKNENASDSDVEMTWGQKKKLYFPISFILCHVVLSVRWSSLCLSLTLGLISFNPIVFVTTQEQVCEEVKKDE